MPRVIVKCRYYKNASSGNLGGMMKYIATREGVYKLPNDQQMLPATDKQNELIMEMATRNPALKASPEFKTYSNKPMRAAASEFIAYAVENNPRILNTEEYLRYMALRPRAEKIEGRHGLFSSEEKELDLEQEISKLESHDGNVFSIIVSIKREDAERLGYNTAERWRDMIRANIDKIAEAHRIPVTELCWYGAFHNESHHPHVHLLMYSTSESDKAFLSKSGMDRLRHLFGTEIFIDDLREIYDQQTDVRNWLTNEMRSAFKKLIADVGAGKFISRNLVAKLEELALRLNGCSGKKQYGYLPKGVKEIVDGIVDELSHDDRVEKLYDLWYQAKCSVTSTYTDQLPEKLPLSKEKAFKAIRNALIYEAARLGTELSQEEKQKPDRQSNEKRGGKKSGGASHDKSVIGAAMRLASSIARVFYENYKEYDPEEDDIDKQLRREIKAVKNGKNLVM